MEVSIEKCTILIMESRKRQTTEGIEQPNKKSIKALGGKRKITNTW